MADELPPALDQNASGGATTSTIGRTITTGGRSYNTWEPTYATVDDRGNPTTAGNPYYDPNSVAPVAAPQAALSPQYNALGYQVLRPGETPTPGVWYGASMSSMGNTGAYGIYQVDQSGVTKTLETRDVTSLAGAPAPGPGGLYLTYANGGRTPVLSAVYSPGAVPFVGVYGTGTLKDDQGNTVTPWQAVGYGAGYSGNSSASGRGGGGGSATGDIVSPTGETATSQADQFFGRDQAPIIGGRIAYAQPIGPQQPGMAGTPVAGAPGMYFTGDIAKVNQESYGPIDAGKGTSTPFVSNAATAAPNRSFTDTVIGAGVGVGATLYTGSEVLKVYGESWAKGVSDTTQSVQTGIVGATPDFAKGYVGFMSDITKGATNTVIGGIPATAAALPFAGAWSITNPTGVPGKAVEIGTEMYTTEKEKLFTRPGEFIGDIAGMYIGGKALAPVVDPVVGGVVKGAKAVSPIGVDIARIPTATGEGSNIVATVSTRNPLSVEPPTPRAFAMAGSEIEGLQYGRGSPVPTAIDQGISVQSPALFNVRDASITATDAQVRFLDPFFRQVSKGTAEEPIVNAMFDLKQALPRSEAAIDYAKVQAQPIGSAKQVGISPETKAAVFEEIAKTDARYVGSQALAETIGEKYVRPVVESDIDLSMSAKNFNPSFQALKEIYAQEPTSTVTGGQSARGYSFKTSALEGEHTLGVVGETKDVRTYNAQTAEGSIVKTQTPEYAIESKASRTLGPDIGLGGKPQAPSRLTYTPEEGTSFELGGKKPASDLADIYAASRGIARSAYQEKYYDLGAKYEGISENIKTYAETTGTAEKIALIPEDALAGVQKAPIRPGQVLGVNLDIFPAAEAVEYPLYKAPKTPTVPIAPVTEITTKVKPKDEVYPETKVKEPNPNSFTGKYQEDYATAKETPKGPNQNTFTGWTPEDYAKTAKAETTTYPAATEPIVASRMMASSSYAESAPAATSSYAIASPSTPASYPAAYAPSSSAAAMYPGVAVPYGGSYPIAGPPQAATYPTGYPRGGETTYPTSYPTTAPTRAPSGYPMSSSKVSGRPYGSAIPQKLVALPFEEKEEHKTKRLKSKGKRFGEVFSFDVDKNFKTPDRLTKKSSPKRFTETFGMDTKSTFNKLTFGKLNSPFESINTSKKKRSK